MPPGLSRSTLDDPQEEQRVETHSGDAHRRPAALGSDYEPAYMLGNSGGAIVGLDLVARHGALSTVILFPACWSWRNPAYSTIEDAGFPPLVFLQLLFGYRSLDDLRYAFPDVRIVKDESEH